MAGFVGTSNIITGSLAAKVAGREGSFAVRPEKIVLAGPNEAAQSDFHAVAGTVAATVYLGAFTRTTVAVEGQEMLVISPNTDAYLPSVPGSRVSVRWPTAAIHALWPKHSATRLTSRSTGAK